MNDQRQIVSQYPPLSMVMSCDNSKYYQELPIEIRDVQADLIFDIDNDQHHQTLNSLAQA